MTLPYPRESETGQLQPRAPMPRVAFDVEASLEDEIRFSGSSVEVFGSQYGVSDARAAEAMVEGLRAAVAAHFNERVASPDAEIWQDFVDQARAQMSEHPVLDDGIIDMLRLTIDNL